MTTYEVSKKSMSKTPESPGIYIFTSKTGKPIYIGKAKNLRSRLNSYFALKLERKTRKMILAAASISIIETNSEIEALLLEANLVKKHRPLYNIQLKDDKSPLYIGITKEKFPRILTLRQTQLDKFQLKYTYGPYLNSSSVKRILHMLRRAFPYSDHKIENRRCLRSQIGLCNPCPSEINSFEDGEHKVNLRKKYLQNITKIRKILEGKLKTSRRSLEKEMSDYSKIQNYEEANVIKYQIQILDYITNPPSIPVEEYLKDPNLKSDIRDRELMELKTLINKFINVKKLNRIECYDIAHLAGTNPTASMVTFIRGEPDKKYYRHFKVDPKIKNNDYESMNSILKRRMNHLKDWGTPDLIIVDGGKPQVSAASEVLKDKIPLIGLAKRNERIIIKVNNKFEEKILPVGPALYLIQRLRNEAHRFARRLHHKHVKKDLLH